MSSKQESVPSSRTSSVSTSGNTAPTTQSGTSTPLSEGALSSQNANPSAIDREWALEEERRIARLQQAARELGFDLPPRCYRM
ncbi:hypothetical protein OPT61_g9107 [Boeremia exigua]|uniref:Uncharacterized protein n=1 Tax=Boeremia exigua TaxID=749465 RepID=A0ACC2HX58_9PLEO|nr:hypothetical protein OPT61_g9107 [Boeremia exigua]